MRKFLLLSTAIASIAAMSVPVYAAGAVTQGVIGNIHPGHGQGVVPPCFTFTLSANGESTTYAKRYIAGQTGAAAWSDNYDIVVVSANHGKMASLIPQSPVVCGGDQFPDFRGLVVQ